MIKKTIKRLFLNFIFNKFNTYPKYLSTFMPTEFEIKKIDGEDVNEEEFRSIYQQIICTLTDIS